MAAAEQGSAGVICTVTLIAKVRARPDTHGRRQDVDESNIDDIRVRLLTEMGQTLLIVSLTLFQISANDDGQRKGGEITQ